MFESFVTAGRVDEEFVAKLLVAAKGGRVVPSTSEDDIQNHVDFWWTPNGATQSLGVDVKGLKKIRRNDFRVNNTDTWIETMNVQGNPGWVYGKATYIAFRRIGKVLFVKREALAHYIEEKIAGKQIVGRNPMCCYVPYRRASSFPPRLDIITLVPLDDIEALAEFIIPHR